MASFSLTDPTNFATNGLSVTLFSKTEKAFPNPDLGDILMLRKIVVRLQYHGGTSTTKRLLRAIHMVLLVHRSNLGNGLSST